MRILLEKYFSRGQIVELMYLSMSGTISKRIVKVLKINDDYFQAYCFMKNAKRTFRIENVLACFPVKNNERDVIQ